MKKFSIINLLFIIFLANQLFSCRQNLVPAEKQVAKIVISNLDSLAYRCEELKSILHRNTVSQQTKLQNIFLQARKAYKKVEWATEYFAPVNSRLVNGPPIQEVEFDGTGIIKIIEPAGLQVIESLIYPKYDHRNPVELLKQINIIQTNCSQYKSRFLDVNFYDWHILDACKLELFRMLCVGITGFDNPLTRNSMVESIASLEGIKSALHVYTKEFEEDSLGKSIDAAKAYLNKNKDFNTFNRAKFITTYGNQVSMQISQVQAKLNVHPLLYNRLLNQDAKTLFDTNAFNLNAFLPYARVSNTQKRVALGKMLFFDPILSGKNSRSCASCHNPEKAFSDGLTKNTVLNSKRLLPRNTPTLLNAALQPFLFYDLRVNSLEGQSAEVIHNQEEMHGFLPTIQKKLWRSQKYRKLFSEAYPMKNKTMIDSIEVVISLASYMRSLVKLTSRFDLYMRGDKSKLSAQEIDGLNLAMGKAKCATCHYLPLFNGTFPPRYTKMDAEVIGVPQTKEGKKVDPDLGRYNIVDVSSLKYAFKTSTLRNAALTAPYMHNGVYDHLEEVLEFYNKGGGQGIGLNLNNQTLPSSKLNLSKVEIAALIAF